MSLQEHLRRLRSADIREEYSCLNTLQRTEWAINLPLLAVTENTWARGPGSTCTRFDTLRLFSL